MYRTLPRNSEAASDYLLRSIELGQRRSEAYYYLGRIAEERGHTAQAIAYYSKVAHGNEYLAACSRVGQILIAQSKWQRLASWFDEQRTTQPESRAQLYGLEAELLSQADQYDKAMAVYDQAIEELPENIPLRYARAMLYDKRGDLASMEQDLRSILATDPDNATALNALGYTLADAPPGTMRPCSKYPGLWNCALMNRRFSTVWAGSCSAPGVTRRQSTICSALTLRFPTRRWPRTLARCYGRRAISKQPATCGGRPCGATRGTRY